MVDCVDLCSPHVCYTTMYAVLRRLESIRKSLLLLYCMYMYIRIIFCFSFLCYYNCWRIYICMCAFVCESHFISGSYFIVIIKSFYIVIVAVHHLCVCVFFFPLSLFFFVRIAHLFINFFLSVRYFLFLYCFLTSDVRCVIVLFFFFSFLSVCVVRVFLRTAINFL